MMLAIDITVLTTDTLGTHTPTFVSGLEGHPKHENHGTISHEAPLLSPSLL